MDLALNSVLVFAPDLAQARAFYGGILGLRPDGDGEGFVAFQGLDFRLVVFRCERDSQPDDYARKAGSSLALTVPDLDAAIVELTSKGVRFLHATPNEGPLGRYAAFTDPFGTVHELIESADHE